MSNWLAQLERLVDQGGQIIPALMVLSLVLWTLIIERFWFLHLAYPSVRQQQLTPWLSRSEYHSWYASSIREQLYSEITGLLQQRQSAIRTLIALCPLLGLLGTVSGMIAVFDTISLTGNSDAKAMAAGIYRATLPTMAGLVLALSALYFSHRLNQKTRQLSDELAASLNHTGAAP